MAIRLSRAGINRKFVLVHKTLEKLSPSTRKTVAYLDPNANETGEGPRMPKRSRSRKKSAKRRQLIPQHVLDFFDVSDPMYFRPTVKKYEHMDNRREVPRKNKMLNPVKPKKTAMRF